MGVGTKPPQTEGVKGATGKPPVRGVGTKSPQKKIPSLEGGVRGGWTHKE